VLVKRSRLFDCEHHLVAFHGVRNVGYIPAWRPGHGLSKIARLVDLYAIVRRCRSGSRQIAMR
jgi:GTP cyclohydrolase I